MGGNNIKEKFTRRYNKKEYFEFSKIVIATLEDKMPGIRFAVVQAYKNKETFGDLDILVEDFDDFRSRDWIKEHQSELGITTLVQTKPESLKKPEMEVYSVLGFGGEIQIDFIFTQTQYFSSSVDYFSFNDLGNMIGRVAASMGLRYGHKGLLYRLYDSKNKAQLIKEIIISNDTSSILQFLGYDYERYIKGFDTVESVIEYAVSSRFFNVEYCKLENRNYKARIRDKKRENYIKLLKHIDNKNLKTSTSITSHEEGLAYATSYFPDFYVELKKLELKYIKNKETAKKARDIVKSKFSNQIVSEITGLKGKPLGYFLESINKHFKSENKTLSEGIKTMSKIEIKEMILSNTEKQKNNALIYPPVEAVNELSSPLDDDLILTFHPLNIEKEKVLVTDCDGVLVSWFSKIPEFLDAKGICSQHLRDAMENNSYLPFNEIFKSDSPEESKRMFLEYNESALIRELEILDPGVIEAISSIANKVKIIVLTNLSDNGQARLNRIHNLTDKIGDHFFDVISLAPESNKTSALKELNEKYNVIMWIDDTIKHVKEALEAGIENSFQFTYGMTCGRNTGEVNEIDSWSEVDLKISDLLR